MSPPASPTCGVFHKRLRAPEEMPALLRRTDALRSAGIPTPAICQTDDAGMVAFDHIRGIGGKDLIARHGAAALPHILRPLAQLHETLVPALPEHDAYARIRQRLGSTTPPWISRTAERCRETAKSAAMLTTVHGDFHAGQVIRDDDGVVWLLDLDDLALGPPEADLGNFVAHLATWVGTRRDTVRDGFDYWRHAAQGAFSDTGGRYQAALVASFGRLALIRRALKLAEQGDRSVVGEVSRWL